MYIVVDNSHKILCNIFPIYIPEFKLYKNYNTFLVYHNGDIKELSVKKNKLSTFQLTPH